MRNDGQRPWRYHAVSFASRVVLRSWFGRGLTIEGADQVPSQGPLLVVSNHLSNIDPFLFGGYGPGAMFCLAKLELYSNPVVAWMLGGCNCYPIDRGAADRWALRMTLQLLARRGRVVIFVEGTRASTPGMKRAESGVGFLARRSGARLLPVAISGTERALPRDARTPRRVPVRVRFGEPFAVDVDAASRRDDQAIADQIGRRIAQLLPAEYRGYYA